MRKVQPPPPHRSRVRWKAQAEADHIGPWRCVYTLKWTPSSSSPVRRKTGQPPWDYRIDSKVIFFSSKTSTHTSVLKHHSSQWEMVPGPFVWEWGYEYAASEVAEAISNLGRFLSFLAPEQSHHLGNLGLRQAASAVCWGRGEEGGCLGSWLLSQSLLSPKGLSWIS